MNQILLRELLLTALPGDQPQPKCFRLRAAGQERPRQKASGYG